MDNLADVVRGEVQAAGAGKCLLWVDPVQRDPFDDALKNRRVRVPINDRRFSPQRAPYLVALDLAVAGDAALFDASVARARQAWTLDSLTAECGQSICGWVITRASADTVANHWGWRCHLHGHDGKSKLLRFHDPGVREWLWPVLSDKQRRDLMGPATQLFGVGRRQEILRHTGPAGDPSVDYLKLDDRQWQQIGDYATVHAAWLACARAQSDLVTPVNEQAVLAVLAHADRYGVTHPSDRIVYALHAMQLGAHFHTDARMQAVWQRTRADDYYASAIEEVFGCTASALHLHWTAQENKP